MAELLLNGTNVILQAPTGAGKTHAALLPFLAALEQGHAFPQKCLYSVPMRVLANQFVDDYRARVLQAGRIHRIRVEIQTGDQSSDPQLTSELIFATIDQTLSSFLLAPYSLPRSQANMNAAAVMASYLVFDEFHLYDPTSTLPTTLHMLRMLKGIAPFILMTATFSENMLVHLAEMLNAAVIPGSISERAAMQQLASQQKTRRFHTIDHPLSAEYVLREHKSRSLVICNTVDRARGTHAALRRATEGTPTRVLLLHSRFLREDRDRIENQIREAFSKEATKDDNLIVVSTQAIEVGVDITSTTLHTELAPANALLQRAGRCARYAGETGDVIIYRHVPGNQPGEIIDLTENVAPYMSQKDEFVRTWDAFVERDGTTLDFADEQSIITYVHGSRDEQIIAQLHADSFNHRRRMFSVMRGDDTDDARNLIRDAWQQSVTIHADPDQLLEMPFDVPSFGLHPGTLRHYVKLWLERSDDLDIDNPIQYLKPMDGDAYEYAVQANLPPYSWEPVYTVDTVAGASLVVIHPALATYDADLGFIPDQGGTWQIQIPTRPQRSQHRQYLYRLETYAEHITLVHDATFNSQDGTWHEMAWLAHQLEHFFQWKSGSLRQATELAVLLHDVGKLNIKWQQWVRDYQKRIGRPIADGQVYAHTDLLHDEHRTIERAMWKRPWHAVEGALAVLPFLANHFGNAHPLTDAVFTAIARHHAASSNTNRSFRLVSRAVDYIKQTHQVLSSIELWGIDADVPADAGAGDIIPGPDDKLPAFFAYLLIARVLRRGDQAGTARGTGATDE